MTTRVVTTASEHALTVVKTKNHRIALRVFDSIADVVVLVELTREEGKLLVAKLQRAAGEGTA